MLSDKPWRLDSVLFLLAGVLCCVFLGSLGVMLFRKLSPGLPAADGKFIEFLIGAVSFQCIPLGMVHLFLRQHDVGWRDFLGLRRAGVNAAVLRGALVALIVLPVAHLLAEYAAAALTAIESKAPAPQHAIEVLKGSNTPGKQMLFAFTAVVLAPLMEEILFRGVLYAVIKEAGHPRAALWLSSLAFAAIHANKMSFVPLMFFAVILALLYERTGRLIAPIAAHAAFNAANIIMHLAWVNGVGRGGG